jgi:hypothetical protein
MSLSLSSPSYSFAWMKRSLELILSFLSILKRLNEPCAVTPEKILPLFFSKYQSVGLFFFSFFFFLFFSLSVL